MNTKVRLITLLFISIMVSTTIVNAQWIRSSGDVIKETRNVDKFESIKSSSSADVIITQGNTQSVVVESDANLVPYIITKVDDGVLVIDIKKNYKNINILKVHITVPNLESIVISGSGDIKIPSVFKTNELYVKINGSGDLSAKFDVKSLEYRSSGSGDGSFSGVKGILKIYVNGSGDITARDLRLSDCNIKVSGSGDLNLSGSSEDLVIAVNGSGDIDAYQLQSVNVTVTVSGSGDIYTHPIESIHAKIAGSGDVYYKGDPVKTNISTSGSGDLIKR